MLIEDNANIVMKNLVVTRSEVSEALQNIEIDLELTKEIHALVTNALSNGHDEEISFKKMLNSNEKTRHGKESVMSEKLNHLIAEKTTRAKNEDCAFDEAWLRGLASSDIIIYWPYSEDWDGKELPTVVVAPEDPDAEEAEGIKITLEATGYQYEKVIVNEDYALAHPVWVINEKADDPNVIYAKTSDVADGEWYSTRAVNTSITIWRLVQMKVTRQYDGIFMGGSEMDIQVAYPIIPGNVLMSSKFRVDFSRKSIRNESWKSLSLPLNTNWRIEQLQNGLVLSEWDGGGGTREIKVAVTYKDENQNTITTEIDCSIEGDDDYLGQQVIDRYYAYLYPEYTFDSNHVILRTAMTFE